MKTSKKITVEKVLVVNLDANKLSNSGKVAGCRTNVGTMWSDNAQK